MKYLHPLKRIKENKLYSLKHTYVSHTVMILMAHNNTFVHHPLVALPLFCRLQGDNRITSSPLKQAFHLLLPHNHKLQLRQPPLAPDSLQRLPRRWRAAAGCHRQLKLFTGRRRARLWFFFWQYEPLVFVVSDRNDGGVNGP